MSDLPVTYNHIQGQRSQSASLRPSRFKPCGYPGENCGMCGKKGGLTMIEYENQTSPLALCAGCLKDLEQYRPIERRGGVVYLIRDDSAHPVCEKCGRTIARRKRLCYQCCPDEPDA